MMINLKELGDRLKQMRHQMGVSQKVLAEEIGVTQTSISRLENGEDIYATALLAILLFFQSKISLDYLVSKDFVLGREQSNSCNSVIQDSVFRQIDNLKDAIKDVYESSIQQLNIKKSQLLDGQ